MAELTVAQAVRLRMTSLLLRPTGPDSGDPPDVAGVVGWFGAMQAQDLGSGLWSFGVRLPGFTVADVDAALERREALRTWPMRGTVHFVPSRDARWMLELMGARPLAGAAARRAYLGLSEQTADRAVEVLGEALSGGRRLTRAECLTALAEAGIEQAGQRGYHLLWYASQRGVTCIAPNVGGEQTFVLLDEWVPDPARPDRDEALAIMALRYFQSHGPATRQDFAGWTGMTAVDAKRGIAVAGDALTAIRVDGREMIVATRALAAWQDGGTDRAGGADRAGGVGAGGAGADAGGGDPDAMLAPPGFDEYMLGFKDRSFMLAPGDLAAIVPGGNGVFRPTLVRAGRVLATWTKTVTKTRVTIDVRPLASPWDASDRAAAELALGAYARFLGLPALVRWP